MEYNIVTRTIIFQSSYLYSAEITDRYLKKRNLEYLKYPASDIKCQITDVVGLVKNSVDIALRQVIWDLT